jgi:hypothetical protein
MKIRIMLVIVVAAFLAAPSFAALITPREPVEQPVEAYSGDYDYGTGAYLDNPCTTVQDWYYVNYNAYVTQTGTKLAASDRYRITETTSLAGSYSASGTGDADITYTGKAFSTREYHKVTSTTDMFHIVTVINVDPATQQTTITFETACGNGMPDSKQ